MSANTKIEWADHSWNPWIGCTKVSPGCLNCYAAMSPPARVDRADGKERWGKGNARRRTSAATWKEPLKWNQEAENTGLRPRVFPSLCDPFDDEVTIEWLADFLKLIFETPYLNWLLLTKRPENWRKRLLAVRDAAHDGMEVFFDQWLDGFEPHNVWVGTSVEDQTRADQRIPELLKIPAKLRFLSVEPLLDMVDLANLGCSIEGKYPFFDCLTGADAPGMNYWDAKVHWVIVGGESGPGARPCNVAWVRSVLRQCQAVGVPCFVKQLGAKPTVTITKGQPMPDDFRAFSHPKGGDPAEWPEDLRVREIPGKEVAP